MSNSDSSIRNLSDAVSKLIHVLDSYVEAERNFEKDLCKSCDLCKVPTSTLQSIFSSIHNMYEKYKSKNQAAFVDPLRKILDMIPAINDLFLERERLLKDLDRKTIKIKRSESSENADLTAKSRKRVQEADSIKQRLNCIEGMIGYLGKFTSEAENFLSSSFDVHLNMNYTLLNKSAQLNKQLAELFCADPNDADVAKLDDLIESEMLSIYQTLFIKPNM